MAYKGKTQLTYVIVAPPDQVDEGDRIFQSHAPWMGATHHRDGEKALLQYTVSKAPELSNPFDEVLQADRQQNVKADVVYIRIVAQSDLTVAVFTYR